MLSYLTADILLVLDGFVFVYVVLCLTSGLGTITELFIIHNILLLRI